MNLMNVNQDKMNYELGHIIPYCRILKLYCYSCVTTYYLYPGLPTSEH